MGADDAAERASEAAAIARDAAERAVQAAEQAHVAAEELVDPASSAQPADPQPADPQPADQPPVTAEPPSPPAYDPGDGGADGWVDGADAYGDEPSPLAVVDLSEGTGHPDGGPS